MKKMQLLCLLFALVIFGCERRSTLEHSMVNFSEKDLDICRETSCPEVSVSYFLASGDDDRVEKINQAVKSFIAGVLYLGDETTTPEAVPVDEAITEFIKMYRTHNAEFPDMQLEYFAEIDVVESLKSGNLLSLEMRYYLFTGGAHGYGATQYYNFDLETGELLSMEELFSDIPGLEAYAEKRFREENGISKGANINETGFWFENDSFHLPEAVGFSADTLRLHYNQYEIASYAAGPVELNIPLKEISNLISISFE